MFYYIEIAREQEMFDHLTNREGIDYVVTPHYVYGACESGRSLFGFDFCSVCFIDESMTKTLVGIVVETGSSIDIECMTFDNNLDLIEFLNS